MNILFITVDCLRPDHLSCYGYKKMKTPNIDALARQGIMFENMHCQAPYTSASHASFLTGLNPYEHGVRDMLNCRLHSGVQTLPEIMKENGFHTAAFVGLSFMSKYGLSRGFDVFDQDSVTTDWEWEGRKLGNDWRKSYLEWTRERKDPWFCWLHYFFTHKESDFLVPKQYIGVGEDNPHKAYKNYDAKIKWFDDEWLPTILSEVDMANTIVILTADHGESIYNTGRDASHRRALYEDTIKVPCIISDPTSTAPKGHVVKEFVHTLGVLPGAMAGAGLRGYKTENSKRPEIYCETTFEDYFMKGVILHCQEGRYSYPLKYIMKNGEPHELYDLRNDPKEEKNLIQSSRKPRSFRKIIKMINNHGDHGENICRVDWNDQQVMEQLKALGYVD